MSENIRLPCTTIILKNDGFVSVKAVPHNGYKLKSNTIRISERSYEELVKAFEDYGECCCEDYEYVLRWLKNPKTKNSLIEV